MIAQTNQPELKILDKYKDLMTYNDTVIFLGGYVEQIKLKTGDVLLVNEDAIRLGLPVNIKATAIYRLSQEPQTPITQLSKIDFQQVSRAGGYNILGNAVLITKDLSHILFSDEENTDKTKGN